MTPENNEHKEETSLLAGLGETIRGQLGMLKILWEVAGRVINVKENLFKTDTKKAVKNMPLWYLMHHLDDSKASPRVKAELKQEIVDRFVDESKAGPKQELKSIICEMLRNYRREQKDSDKPLSNGEVLKIVVADLKKTLGLVVQSLNIDKEKIRWFRMHKHSKEQLEYIMTSLASKEFDDLTAEIIKELKGVKQD